MSSRLNHWDQRFNSWKKNPKMESCSGVGSSLVKTRNTLQTIEKVFKEHQIKKFLDLPCGDLNWMSKASMNGVEYTGMDLSPSLISYNKQKYGQNKKFVTHDIVKDEILEKFDLILCRDLLFHLSSESALAALNNFKKSGSKYLLTTTFPNINENISIKDNEWYPINLEIAPFNFPPPIALYQEVEDGKCLGLWKLTENF